jgi:hypothetical protein
MLELVCTTLIAAADIGTGVMAACAPVTLHSSQPGHPHACQYAAASGLVAMTCLSDQHKLPAQDSALCRGPFRGLMLQAGLVNGLIALAGLDWPSDALRASMRILTATGLMSLSATVGLMPAIQMTAVRTYIRARLEASSVAKAELQLLANALWMLSRQADIGSADDSRDTAIVAISVMHVCLAHQLQCSSEKRLEADSVAERQASSAMTSHLMDALEVAVIVLWQSCARLSNACRPGENTSGASLYLNDTTTILQVPLEPRYTPMQPTIASCLLTSRAGTLRLIDRRPRTCTARCANPVRMVRRTCRSQPEADGTVRDALRPIVSLLRLPYDAPEARRRREQMSKGRQLAARALWSLMQHNSAVRGVLVDELVCRHCNQCPLRAATISCAHMQDTLC